MSGNDRNRDDKFDELDLNSNASTAIAAEGDQRSPLAKYTDDRDASGHEWKRIVLDEVGHVRGSTVKIVLIGDIGVGKSSMADRFILGDSADFPDTTIGMVQHWLWIKANHPVYNQNLKLHIIDSAGQERFGGMIPQFIKGAACVILVFDLTRPDTWRSLFTRWHPMLEKHGGTCPRFLVGAKWDAYSTLPEINRWLDHVDVETEAKKLGCVQFHLVSSLVNVHINAMFVRAAELGIRHLSEIYDGLVCYIDNDTVDLASPRKDKQTATKRACAC